ncbi:calcium uniporter protein 2, mitochondrial-like [Ananas comosus]|uniref:Calcium uniporter protein 2, mitochondrial-like n=1 Tax=Ananas comosus TaxID=4615 RepID=A0A6P5FF09_ANACO|nr:calcium uniporter protein 2, mitochondrial-like [Ananas comosus]
MALLRKTLAQRLSRIARICSPVSQIRSPTAAEGNRRRHLLPGAADEPGIVRRFLQKRPIFEPALPPDRAPFLPSGDRLAERIRGLSPGRIRLDGLAPPPPQIAPAAEEERGVTVEEARKVLRAAQMEAARARLRAIPGSVVPYAEFLRVCCDASSSELGLGIARSLDESGSVIVLGDSVFLRPELVIKAIENVVPLPTPNRNYRNDPRREELRAMEATKAEIDRIAAAQVRRELWAGLGFLVVQTAGFMRLTFWELSWDVMEPICFYVTSVYFMAGYAFFLRTSRDPSFEGFFESRFSAKQKRLMRARSFDLDRFNELRRACPLPPALPPDHSQPIHSSSSSSSSSSYSCHCCH